MLINIAAKPEVIKELERVMRINEDVLRFLTVKVEEHEKAPSSLLKASRYQRDEYDDNARSELSDNEEESGEKFNDRAEKESD